MMPTFFYYCDEENTSEAWCLVRFQQPRLVADTYEKHIVERLVQLEYSRKRIWQLKLLTNMRKMKLYQGNNSKPLADFTFSLGLW